MADWQQYVVLGFGLFVAAGFAVQGIVSYSSVVDQGPSQGGETGEMNLELPAQHYSEDGFDRSPRELVGIATSEDVVFVNGFYQTQEDKENLRTELEELPEEFDNRVYVGLENSTESDIARQSGFNEFPTVYVLGSSQLSTPTQDITNENIRDQVCDEFNSLGDQASNCVG